MKTKLTQRKQIPNPGKAEMQQRGPDRSDDDEPQTSPHSANWPMASHAESSSRPVPSMALPMPSHPTVPRSQLEETSAILVLCFKDNMLKRLESDCR